MKIIKNLCKTLDCYGAKVLYNGFNNTITEFDSELQKSLEDKNSIYFDEYFTEVLCEYDIEDIRLKSSTRLGHAIICLTDNCNMRCKYCGYHDTRYKENGNFLKDIDEITLKNALDFVIARSVDAYETTISFYGGEPLLRFSLVKFAIEYLEGKNRLGHKYKYRITTNGTLLEADTIDYLVNRNVKCVISLDGPVFIHDRYRVYEENTPTYADCITNLKELRKRFPNYYENNITFQAVISPPHDRSIPEDYFAKSEVLFLDANIGDYFSKLLKNEHDLDLNGIKTKERNIVHKQMANMDKDDLMSDIVYVGSLKKYMNVGEKNIRKTVFPPGFCVPLLKRIYIGSNGKIVLCERVDDSNPLFQLGCVTTGYNFDKIEYLYAYTNSVLAENCNQCWAFRFCRACFAKLDKIEFNGDFCRLIRDKVEQELIDFLDFKFNNKRFNEIMQSISVE